MRKEILYGLAGLTLALLVIYSNFIFAEFFKPVRKTERLPLEIGIKEAFNEAIKPFTYLSYILIISFVIASIAYFIAKKKLKLA